VPRADGAYDLRWFTPTDEVDLCGHATLAASSVLWEVHRADTAAPITFHTKSGALTATRSPDGIISLDFPSEVASAVPDGEEAEYAAQLVHAFGLQDAAEVLWVGRNRIGGPGGGDLIVEVTAAAFERLAPVPSDLTRAGSLLQCRVLSVTCRGCPPAVALPTGGHAAAAYDFSSRGFAPCVGVDEDPVCGSVRAHPHPTPDLPTRTPSVAA